MPHGAISSLRLGNGVTETWSYNNRLQPFQILANGPSANELLKLQLAYGCGSGLNTCASNNGNVTSQSIIGVGVNLTQSYCYDKLNRLTGVAEQGAVDANCGSAGYRQAYGYDRFGNRWLSANAGFSTNTALTNTAQSTIDAATNRLTGPGTVTYDQRGNRTSLSPMVLAYDGDDKVKSAEQNSTNPTVQRAALNFYDGDGRRVRKFYCSNLLVAACTEALAAKTTYVYDAFGNLAREELVGGAAAGAADTEFLTTDHLGSARLVTNASGAEKQRYDYLPFGEGIVAGANGNGRPASYAVGVYPGDNDGRSLKFTGKERDFETGLDFFGARYLSAAMGRWTSADRPFADQLAENPQSWNLYAYVRNNPVGMVDDDGRGAKDFIYGAMNAFNTNHTLGVGRQSGGNQDFKNGQAVGDAVSTVVGMAEMALGAGGEVLGLALDATGVGAIAGVPINVASAALAAEGLAVTVGGAGHLTAAAMGAVKDGGGSGRGPNPDGSKGKPDHQKKVGELADKAAGELKAGERIEVNKKIQGHDSNRRPDVQIVDSNNRTRKIYEAERRPNSRRNRRREAEYDRLGIEHETHPLD